MTLPIREAQEVARLFRNADDGPWIATRLYEFVDELANEDRRGNKPDHIAKAERLRDDIKKLLRGGL